MFEHNNENAKQVLKGLSNPDSQYRYDNMPCDCDNKINELTKRIEELEKKDRRTMSNISDLLTGQDDLVERMWGAVWGKALEKAFTSQCECKQKAEPVEPAEWTPEIGKPCLYSGDGYVDAEGIIVQKDEDRDWFLVYLYEDDIAYRGERDVLKPMPEKE